MRKFTGYRLQVTGLIAVLVFAYYLLHTTNYRLPTTLAAEDPCIFQLNNYKASGLVSSPDFVSIKVNVNGQKICVKNDRAAFVSYKLPTYDDLKSIYFDQARPTASSTFDKTELPAGDKLDGDLSLGGSKDHLYYVNGTLRIKNNMPGSKSAVIFVKNDLRISASQLTTGSNGIVFVVGGNAYIWGDPSIASSPPTTRVDAVIIAQGLICTGYNTNLDSACPAANFLSSQLTVNGSLISLNQNPGSNIQFRRLLSDNSQPAELIRLQAKYLVILKDMFSDTLQKWSEIQ